MFIRLNICTCLQISTQVQTAFSLALRQFFTKIIHHLWLKLKPKHLKLIVVPYSGSYDLYHYAISACPSGESETQQIVITIHRLDVKDMYTILHIYTKWKLPI